MEKISVLLQPVYMMLCNFSWRGGSQSVFKDIITVCRTICWVDEGDEHFTSKKHWMMMKIWTLTSFDMILYSCKKKKSPFIRQHTSGITSELLKLLTSYSCWAARLTLHSLHSPCFDKSAKFLLRLIFLQKRFFKNFFLMLYTDCERALENHQSLWNFTL